VNKILKLFSHEEFIYLGDSDHDADACRSAGGKFLLINTREYDNCSVRVMNPIAVIETLTEIIEDICS
jgi:phosphoglycolate phosphatase-like HAD superfamily hydrolase